MTWPMEGVTEAPSGPTSVKWGPATHLLGLEDRTRSHRGQRGSVLDGGCSHAWPSLASGLQAPRNWKPFRDHGPESLCWLHVDSGQERCWPCDGSGLHGVPRAVVLF